MPTMLIVKSDGARGCIRSFVIGDQEKILPVTGETRIDLDVLQPGRPEYACGMGTIEELGYRATLLDEG